jgi:CRP-like cAMP-binding protein
MPRASQAPSARNLELLAKAEFFSEFSPGERQEVLNASRILALEQGDCLFEEGAACDALYLLLQGAVKMSKISSEGKEQVLRHLEPGQVFGAAPLFSPQGAWPALAVALEPSRVLCVPKPRLLALLKRDPELMLKVLGVVAGHLQELMRLLESVSLDKVPRRLAQYLLRLAKQQGGPKAGQVLDLKQSQAALAAELGTVREVVSRALRRFQKEGTLKVDGQQLTLLLPQALEEI